MMGKLPIRRGDTVRVLRGKDRGKTGAVLAVAPFAQRVLVEGVNVVLKHVRPRRAGEKGQRVRVAAPVHVSAVQVVCPSCKRGTRIARRLIDDRRQRVCTKCGAVIAAVSRKP